jgi:Amt family ammonium transporter
MEQLIKQAEAVVVTLVWSGVISFVLLKIIDAVIGLRVTRDQEMEGLDIVLHGESIG